VGLCFREWVLVFVRGGLVSSVVAWIVMWRWSGCCPYVLFGSCVAVVREFGEEGAEVRWKSFCWLGVLGCGWLRGELVRLVWFE